uniref:Uncharacterized protein n=1 Tax=Rhizophora mucronata TaxID=61149 RepID=A0A2P2QXS1_RHIMU
MKRPNSNLYFTTYPTSSNLQGTLEIKFYIQATNSITTT